MSKLGNPTNNTAVPNGQSINFSYLCGGQQDGLYFTTGNGSYGDIQIEFPANEKPTAVITFYFAASTNISEQ